jgi:hypothetical protein
MNMIKASSPSNMDLHLDWAMEGEVASSRVRHVAPHHIAMYMLGTCPREYMTLLMST